MIKSCLVKAHSDQQLQQKLTEVASSSKHRRRQVLCLYRSPVTCTWEVCVHCHNAWTQLTLHSNIIIKKEGVYVVNVILVSSHCITTMILIVLIRVKTKTKQKFKYKQSSYQQRIQSPVPFVLDKHNHRKPSWEL